MPGADPSGLHVQRALHLRTFPAFAELSPEALAVLAEPCEEQAWAQGQPLLRSGAPAATLHFILDGEVEVRREGVLRRTMHEREAVGGLALLTEDPDGVDAVAARPTRTLALARASLLEVFADHPEIRTAVTRALARTLLNRTRAAHARGAAPEAPGLAETRPPRGSGSTPADEPASDPEGPQGIDVEGLMHLFGAFSFAGATVTAASDLTREATRRHAVEGQRLWSRGDPASQIWVLVSGEVEARPEEGRPYRLGPGAVLGALDALAARPRWTTTVATQPASALVLTADGLLDTGEDHPGFGFGLLRALARAVERSG